MGRHQAAPGDGAASTEAAIAEVAGRVSNWRRWGESDVLGTLNFIDEHKRASAAGLVRSGEAISLAIEYGRSGPQKGTIGRFNPMHAMMRTADSKTRDLPHGFGSADDVIVMPTQCATHWDGLGHIFDRGSAWNGRDGGTVVTVDGDDLSGIEKVAHAFVSRGVLLDVGRTLGDGELADGFAITAEDLDATIAGLGPTAAIAAGDIVLVRTGQLSRCRREGWGDYAGGPAPGLSFGTIEWLHDKQVAAVATDTWGAEVRPNEFHGAYQPWHQVVIPHMGLYVGEMFDLDDLASRCLVDRRYEFLLVASPLPISGAVAGPVHPLALR